MSLVNLFRKSDPPPEPAAAPDALIAERDRAMAALNRFAAFGARVGEAQGAADRANVVLREFVAAETAALAQWAESGDGEAPKRDLAKHAELVAACDAAAREYDAAVAARDVVGPAYSRALAAVGAVQLRLDERRAEGIAAEALREVDALADIIADAHRRFARIVGAREALYRQAGSIATAARPIGRSLGRLPRRGLPTSCP